MLRSNFKKFDVDLAFVIRAYQKQLCIKWKAEQMQLNRMRAVFLMVGGVRNRKLSLS